MSSNPENDYLERVKAEIRAEADAARLRVPLPRLEPPPRARQQVASSDDVDRARLDYTISELVAFDYIAFIDHAFRALLKRAPDDAGSELQVRLLAAGGSKAEVLGNLRYSPEGRRIGARVRGLLPRYVLAKLARVRIVGYFVEWAIAFAGLPMLLRHQRAAATSVAARFGELTDAKQRNAQAIADLAVSHAALSAEHDRRSEALREEIHRIQLRVDDLEATADMLGRRTAASTHELAELRHYVHAANHWVASLQRSLVELEEAAQAERSRAQALAAALTEDPAEAAARNERHVAWAVTFAKRLPVTAQVLDLDSGDGGWLQALAAHGIQVSGVESNAALVERAQRERAPVALGESFATLQRCAAASLDGVTLARSVLGDTILTATDVLAECGRVLKPGGYLLLHFERDSRRWIEPAAAGPDPQAWLALLSAAGFATPEWLSATAVAAVLARRAAS